MVALLWRSSNAQEHRAGEEPPSFRLSLMVEAVMFTLVLAVFGGLQTSLVGLYGLLVLFGGLVGGSRCALRGKSYEFVTAQGAMAFG